jgi:hypothetical protein
VRVDAHTELAPDYTARGVETLARTGAASVGGVMAAAGRPGVQAAIARAYNSRFGLGGARYHDDDAEEEGPAESAYLGIMVATGRPGFQAAVARAYNSRFGLGGGAYHGEQAHEGPAESAYMGIMRASVIAEIGGFDETLRRGEDWELNYRLRTAGHLVWLDPQLRVSYWPRSTWAKRARQFFATGIWRGELVRRLGVRNPLRFFAPPLLVIATALSILLIPFLATGLISGWPAWVLSLVFLGPLAYVVLLVFVGVTSSGSLADRARLALVIATMHLSWGLGFLMGVVRGAKDAVDTSRTES